MAKQERQEKPPGHRGWRVCPAADSGVWGVSSSWLSGTSKLDGRQISGSFAVSWVYSSQRKTLGQEPRIVLRWGRAEEMNTDMGHRIPAIVQNLPFSYNPHHKPKWEAWWLSHFVDEEKEGQQCKELDQGHPAPKWVAGLEPSSLWLQRHQVALQALTSSWTHLFRYSCPVRTDSGLGKGWKSPGDSKL